MPEFQRLVIWLHSDKKIIIIMEKRRTNNLCKSIKLKEKEKKICPIPEQSHIQNI